MPNRIQHIKLVAPNPAVVRAFLTQVCEIPDSAEFAPEGRDRPDPIPVHQPLGPGDGQLTLQDITDKIATEGPGTGDFYIVGDTASRQFQIRSGAPGDVWAIVIASRDVDAVRARAVARGIVCSPVENYSIGLPQDDRAFFCIVEGITFELIQFVPKGSANAPAG
jgi:hypothetical protein